VLLFKILLAPVLIAAVTLAGRKWGPAVAGWLLGLPLTSGPVLLFFALEQGPQFSSQAARGCLLGLIAWAAFTIVYAYCCRKFSWPLSTILGWLAYFAVAAALLPMTMNVVWAFLLVILALIATLVAFPPGAPARDKVLEEKNELWMRMISAAVIVLSLTGLAKLLGPTKSGLLTTVPAYSTILAVFTHRQQAAAAITVLKGVVTGLFTAAVFFLIISLALLRIGWLPAFALATLGALVMQVSTLLYLRRTA
jgi:hypothetical protein